MGKRKNLLHFGPDYFFFFLTVAWSRGLTTSFGNEKGKKSMSRRSESAKESCISIPATAAVHPVAFLLS